LMSISAFALDNQKSSSVDQSLKTMRQMVHVEPSGTEDSIENLQNRIHQTLGYKVTCKDNLLLMGVRSHRCLAALRNFVIAMDEGKINENDLGSLFGVEEIQISTENTWKPIKPRE